MTNQINAELGCVLVGDYVDEGVYPKDPAVHRGEVERPTVVADLVDHWGRDDVMREFTVLLRDGCVVDIRGHGLKHTPHPLAGQDVYSIVVRNGTEEVLIALFKSADVAGIFQGNMRPDRKIA